MADPFEARDRSLGQIRAARAQAEMLRDQLSGEYERLAAEEGKEDARRQEGLEAMRKAIAAANRAIDSIDQALREMGRVTDEPGDGGK